MNIHRRTEACWFRIRRLVPTNGDTPWTSAPRTAAGCLIMAEMNQFHPKSGLGQGPRPGRESILWFSIGAKLQEAVIITSTAILDVINYHRDDIQIFGSKAPSTSLG